MSKNPLAIAKLRVNVKSLASEARIARQEYSRTKFTSLDTHRKTRIREEARYAQLALAFVRGIPYSVVEKKVKVKPCPIRMANKLQRTGIYGINSLLHEWLNS